MAFPLRPSGAESPLPDLAVMYTLQENSTLTESQCCEIHSLVYQYLEGRLSHSALAAAYQTKFHTVAPLERLREILNVQADPIPAHRNLLNPGVRRKMQQWSAIEDTRLIAAIHRFGTDPWNAVARFVGNSRTPSQCSQRWQRSLNPRISRSRWTPEEEARLLALVAHHGSRSWIRVSAEMPHRSDVQCRYRYHQIRKDQTAVVEEAESESQEKEEEEKQAAEKEDSEEKQSAANIDWNDEKRIALEIGARSLSEIFWMHHL
jgi:hypothetical protein